MAARKSKKASAGKATTSGRGRKTRIRYSDAERQNILATAEREGLTAAKVKERFGVTPVTYYSWRKKSGGRKGRRKGGRVVVAAATVGKAVGNAMNIADTIRDEIRSHIRRLLPGILASELGGGEPAGRRGKRK